MNKLIRFILVLILIIFSAIGIAFFMGNSALKAVDTKDKANITFVVADGSSTKDVVSNLKKEGLINSEFYTNLYIKVSKKSGFIAGTFTLRKNMDTKLIIKKLNEKPEVKTFMLTFPEGFRAIDYADIVASGSKIKKEDFIALLNDDAFISELGTKYPVVTAFKPDSNAYYKLEGLLAPNTYEFFDTIDAKGIIEKLVAQSQLEYDEYTSLFSGSSLSVNQIYTLASIIEREAKSYEDRLIVAGIFMNRINQGIILGSDVTTYYGLQINMDERDLTQVELDEKNNYNTRAIEGLPVGPIGNPSRSSIEAALQFTESDYLFFVSDVNAKIYPTKNNSEHDAIIEQLKSEGLWFTYE